MGNYSSEASVIFKLFLYSFQCIFYVQQLNFINQQEDKIKYFEFFIIPNHANQHKISGRLSKVRITLNSFHCVTLRDKYPTVALKII